MIFLGSWADQKTSCARFTGQFAGGKCALWRLLWAVNIVLMAGSAVVGVVICFQCGSIWMNVRYRQDIWEPRLTILCYVTLTDFQSRYHNFITVKQARSGLQPFTYPIPRNCFGFIEFGNPRKVMSVDKQRNNQVLTAGPSQPKSEAPGLALATSNQKKVIKCQILKFSYLH